MFIEVKEISNQEEICGVIEFYIIKILKLLMVVTWGFFLLLLFCAFSQLLPFPLIIDTDHQNNNSNMLTLDKGESLTSLFSFTYSIINKLMNINEPLLSKLSFKSICLNNIADI